MKAFQIMLIFMLVWFMQPLSSGHYVKESISDCPIIGQGYRGPFIVCWHDCDGDGKADRQCFYVFKDNEVKTIDCFYGEDIEQ